MSYQQPSSEDEGWKDKKAASAEGDPSVKVIARYGCLKVTPSKQKDDTRLLPASV